MPLSKEKFLKDLEKEMKKRKTENVTKKPSKPQRPKQSDEERRRKDRERKRQWRAKQKALKAQEASQPAETPIKTKSKKRIRFNKDKLIKKRKPVPKVVEPEQVKEEFGIVEEQHDLPMTSRLCPESVKEDGLREVLRMPEQYLEINIIKQSRVVDAFYISSDKKQFHYNKTKYKVKEEAIYLLPTKSGMFMPTSYYREGKSEPRGFKQLNKGITGKAMSLLYMEQLYITLLYSEETKWNFFIVILSIATLVAYGIGCYFVFFHNGGILPQPQPPISPQVIMPSWGWLFNDV